MTKESIGVYTPVSGMRGGKGMTQAHVYFSDAIEPGMFFIQIVFEPGAYAGYHEHSGHDAILYVVSGKAESYHNGQREILGPGDAVLVKSGEAHATKNVGDADLTILEFCAVPAGAIDPSTDSRRLPLPDALSDW